MKFCFKVFLNAFLIFSCGILFNELSRYCFAVYFDYSSVRYNMGWLHYYFEDDLPGKVSMKQAYIELASKLSIFLYSVIGLLMLCKKNDKADTDFMLPYSIMTLFVLKQVGTSLYFIIHGATFCEYGMFARYFNLPFWGIEWVQIIIGTLITGYFIYYFKSTNKKLYFFISAFLAGVFSFTFICILATFYFDLKAVAGLE